MARIYLRLPQCSYLQDMMPLRRCVVLSSATFLISILVIIFIHSYYVVDSVSSNSTPHFLPTVDYRRDKAQFTSGPNVHYGIVLDCGSSGSRVYVYVWPPHSGNPHDLLNIQELKDQYNQPVVKKISPGLDTFASHPEDASDYLYPLLKFAGSHIPESHHKETLLYILATAGMRVLSEQSQKAILQDLQQDIPKQFDFVVAENNFEVISGKLEGVYAWIAVNYILQKFNHGEGDHPLVAVDTHGENEEVTQHVRRRTVGMIDMGGGSMQIAYELTTNIDTVPKQSIAEFNLGCINSDVEHTYKVYVTTFLGFGANEARVRYESMRVSEIKLKEATNQRLKRAASIAEDKHKLYAKRLFNKSSGNVAREPSETLNHTPSQQDIRSHQHTPSPQDIRSPQRTQSPQDIRSPQRTQSPHQIPVPRLTQSPRHIPDHSLTDPYVNIPDPCLQTGLTLLAVEPYIKDKQITFTGTGEYHKCQEALVPLLNLSKPCDVIPCSMNGVHQPPISFHNSVFYGFSELWYTMEDVFRIGGRYEHDIFDAEATDFCEKKWSLLQQGYKKGFYKKAGEHRFRMQCFKSAWMTMVLHKGLQFPESYINLNSVHVINKRNVQWTLGALIHRTRYLPLREIEKYGESDFKPSWLSYSHIIYNEYLLVVCFIIVAMAIVIYIRRLRICSPTLPRTDLSRVPSMSYFMTEMDQVEQGVRLMSNYTYP